MGKTGTGALFIITVVRALEVNPTSVLFYIPIQAQVSRNTIWQLHYFVKLESKTKTKSSWSKCKKNVIIYYIRLS